MPSPTETTPPKPIMASLVGRKTSPPSIRPDGGLNGGLVSSWMMNIHVLLAKKYTLRWAGAGPSPPNRTSPPSWGS